MVSLPCLPATENSPCHSPSTGVKGSQFMTENKLFANNNKKKQTRKKQPALTGSSATRKIDTSRTTVSAAMQPHSQREAEGSARVMALSGSPASPQCPGEGSLNLLSWDQG